MSVTRIASRYAKSLIDLSVEQNKLERILEDVESFKEVSKNRDFYLLIKSPIVNASKKEDIINSLFNGKYDELTMAFLRILVNKGREAYLPEIADEFILQYKKMKHISSVRLTTATKLSDAAIQSIKDKLLASVDTEDNIELEVIIDPNLIGGFIVEFDDKLYDASVKHKLDKLKKDFTGNLYISQIIAK
jgi:F-type H+-transporting ATPase subunit delta